LQPRPLHFICVTWGAAHTELFLEASLPTQLAPGNLPAVASRSGTTFKLYTTADDVPRLSRSASYRQLTRLMPTEIIPIEVDPAVSCFDILTSCHKAAIKDAAAKGAAMVILAPDLVFADGTFRKLAESVDAGKRAVLTSSVRLSRETFVPALVGRGVRSDAPIKITNREMVDLALEHLHPVSKASFWPPREIWPPNAYWSVGREGFVARSFHMHPLMVVPGKGNVRFSSTVDVGLVDRLCRRPSDIHIVQDSDEMCLFEISPEQYGLDGLRPEPLDTQGLKKWAIWGTNRRQRWRFSHPIRIHRGECSPAWEVVLAQSARDASNVIDLPRLRQWAEAPLVFPTLRAGVRLARLCRKPFARRDAASKLAG
jgi:hypothetical protein